MSRLLFVILYTGIVSYVSVETYLVHFVRPEYKRLSDLYIKEIANKLEVKQTRFEEGQRSVLEQAAKNNHGYFQIDPLDGQSKFHWYTIKIVNSPLPEDQKIPPAIP